MKSLIVSLLASSILCVFAKAEELTYSNTQGEIGEKYQKATELSSLLKLKWDELIELPEPPPEKPEASRLVRLQGELIDSKINQIKDEAEVTYLELQPSIEGREKTELLMNLLHNELAIAVIGQKLKFDRVRPSFINSAIDPVVPNPRHPAYPSGQSTQFHLFAFCLASLNPSEARQYLTVAKRIAVNREFAGLHYKSDTIAGELLARRMVKVLAANETFQAAFIAAANEWGTPREALNRMRIFASFAVRVEQEN